MPVTIRPLDTSTESAWDDFVMAMAGGTFFHRSAWARVIERVFRHRSYFVYAERDGSITGVLPLVQVNTIFFGHSLISNPFCVYGGPLASDAESAAMLKAYAIDLQDRIGASSLEFRYRDAVEDDWVVPPDLYVTFRKAIGPNHDVNMKAIPRKQRAMVRKGLQNGLTSVADRNYERMHAIFAESVHNLGTPAFSPRYFSALLDAFGDDADVVTILDDGDPIASVLNFYFRDEVLPYYGGGTTAARQRAGNDFMYWEVMRRAADRGIRQFDFGRSKIGTGSFSFKHNWGFEAKKLNYRFRLAPGRLLPELNPMNPKYRLLIAAWKRLPLPLANILSPPIIRGLG
jgi:FemAB-related protein (PEP-CTERM system-associated)